MDVAEMDVSENESLSEEDNGEKKVYLPGQEIPEGEELVMDESAYVLYHEAQTGAPCLSFDIVRDGLGARREEFPMTCFLVAGTQAQRAHTNNVILMKMSNLHRTKPQPEGDEESEKESEDEEEGTKPRIETAMLRHTGSVNRIRATVLGERHLAATWAETGKVHLWDLTPAIRAVNDAQAKAAFNRTRESIAPLQTFAGHQVEGFAMDWCSVTAGRLATGDCRKNIHVWNPQEGGEWAINQLPYTGHTASVEDIQWSPNEPNVFASCSVDKSIRIWDARASPARANKMTVENAHDADVNVIHWNANEPFIVSGGDDGAIKIWDLRQLQNQQPVGLFKHHTAPITSIEWHPTESSIFAASGCDDQLTLWDLAVEKDAAGTGPKSGTGKDGSKSGDDPDVPPQLLFIHQGQQDIKELHWHRQLPGVIISTAHTGFNVFRTISV